MNEMIERVALAIEDVVRTSKTFNSEQIARAAIEAMREPTEAMCDAGSSSDLLNWSPEPGEGLDSVSMDVAWKAMIDAALETTK